jgi:histidine triad (HIT) family protein
MSQPNCIFCKIASGEIPSAKVFENAEFVAIRDIQPQAKVHLLVIPKTHVECLDSEGSADINASILNTAVVVARKEGLATNGFRVVVNTREWGGQTVSHLHLHILGGEQLRGRFA